MYKSRLYLAFISAAAISFALASPVNAQTLKVATGSAAGTYSTMFKQLAAQCGNTIPLVEINSAGSQDNLNQIIGNQVSAGFVQSDVLYLRSRTEELGNVKTLLALHSEPVHLLAPAQSGIKEGGTLGIGAKEVVLDNISQLAGRRVGAYGGSAITAQVIRLQSEIPFNVVVLPNEAAVVKAMNDKQVDVALFVGGAPLPFMSKLDANWKLLSIPAPVVEKLKGVYRPARLNYANMNMSGVTTVATDALFVTREYKTEGILQNLAKFRACALNSLDTLKDTTGTHPAWQAVDANNKGKWVWYDLPVVRK